jgi:hypothetical protein
MQSEVRATKETKPQGSVNKLVTPEMRQQIRQLKHDLDECDYHLSRHLELFTSIRDALDTARQTVRCLLTNDPFGAWEKIGKEREHDFGDISLEGKRDRTRRVQVTGNVSKLVTRQMRQQIVEAKKRLENYANCLDEFFDDVTKVRSLDTALELAEDLQCLEPLETWEARKEREEAEREEELLAMKALKNI